MGQGACPCPMRFFCFSQHWCSCSNAERSKKTTYSLRTKEDVKGGDAN